MSRLYGVLPLLVVLALVLAGCPSSSEPSGAPVDEALDTPVVVDTPAVEEAVETPVMEEMATETPMMEEMATETPMAEEEATGTPDMAAGEEVTGTEGMTGTEGGTGAEGATGATEAGVVPISLVEYVIEMPASLPAGPTRFEIMNNGAEEHGFDIEGEGFEASLDPTLQPGESGTLEVDLQPGVYEVYCPVGDHADQGMRLELTVTG